MFQALISFFKTTRGEHFWFSFSAFLSSSTRAHTFQQTNGKRIIKKILPNCLHRNLNCKKCIYFSCAHICSPSRNRKKNREPSSKTIISPTSKKMRNVKEKQKLFFFLFRSTFFLLWILIFISIDESLKQATQTENRDFYQFLLLYWLI